MHNSVAILNDGNWTWSGGLDEGHQRELEQWHPAEFFWDRTIGTAKHIFSHLCERIDANAGGDGPQGSIQGVEYLHCKTQVCFTMGRR